MSRSDSTEPASARKTGRKSSRASGQDSDRKSRSRTAQATATATDGADVKQPVRRQSRKSSTDHREASGGQRETSPTDGSQVPRPGGRGTPAEAAATAVVAAARADRATARPDGQGATSVSDDAAVADSAPATDKAARSAAQKPYPGYDCPQSVEPFTFVLHGSSGDLARRKILPALANMARMGYFPRESRIVLAQRRGMTTAQAMAEEAAFLDENGMKEALASLPSLKPFVQVAQVELGKENAQRNLDAAIGDGPRPVIHYAALPASRFIPLMGLIHGERDPARLRIVLEKPFGFSGAEAKRIEDVVAEHVDESQVYRIDHYVGKQAVQNLVALRLGNLIFEPLLNRHHVKHVQITVAESLGVEDRAGFFEQSGAIRDMVQSHMLQLLAFIAMDPPVSLNADDIRDEKLKVLRALKAPRIAGPDADIVLGQYVAGFVDGRKVPAYQDEPDVNPNSRIESYVALRTEVQTWRWAGVPFLLRTGKRMPQRMAEISVQFREVPHPLFGALGGHWAGNRLVVRMQPEDSLSLHLLAKAPGERDRLQPVALNLDFFDAFRIPVRDAYERLLTDILRGRLSLFLRRDEVATQWAFIDGILDGIRDNDIRPLAYQAGTYGPPDATSLAVRHGAVWSEALRLV